MLVSYKWLKELVPGLEVSAKDLEEKMSTSGIEVEGVTSPGTGLSKLVVGQVLSVEQVPDTHLYLTTVDAGQGEDLQVVCGAPNVRSGMKTITALVGARIGDKIKIKKGKIRGLASEGMLVALDELGIPDSVNPMKHEDGIFELPEDAEVGSPVFSYLDLDDQILDLAITPNRADALSMRGVAHEVAAIYGLEVDLKSPALSEGKSPVEQVLSVKVETDRVPTYKVRVIEGVKVGASPLWLQNRLRNMGIRPINNVVDVTNLILLDFGQPLHAFDEDSLGKEILVRQAKSKETFKTLDGVKRILSPEDIVITSDEKPIALGGVMGGLDSEITQETVNVVLESALFDPVAIRRTSQKFNLRSEASSRFEKGINQGTVREALDMAAALIAELAGGQVLAGLVESNHYQPQPIQVSVTLNQINGALGTGLTPDQVLTVFSQLGFSTQVAGPIHPEKEGKGEIGQDYQEGNQTFIVSIPSRRWDISIAADLIEEVARIYGYDRLPSTLPMGTSLGQLTPMQIFRRHIRSTLEGVGLSEVITYSLTTQEKIQEFAGEEHQTVGLMMPMSEDREVLRRSIIPGLLEVTAYNQNRKNSDLAIYEIGNVFFDQLVDGRPLEESNLAFALSGNRSLSSYQSAARPVDYYDIKGIVELLLVDYPKVSFEPTDDYPGFHPGRSALVKIEDQPVGIVGQIHPTLALKYGISEAYVGNFNLDLLLVHRPHQTTFTEIPKLQPIKRDIALLVSETQTHDEVVTVIQSAQVKPLSQIELFDLYQGDNLPSGKKSMGYTLTFQAQEDPLADEDINRFVDKILKKLVENLQVEVR